jgi:hypothetical protein
MENIQLKQVAKSIFNKDIEIYIQTKHGKWYESKYEKNTESIKLNTVYGISVREMGFGLYSIDFDFKTGKSEDTILKTFVTQFINKYECKQLVIKDGKFCKPDKKEIIEKYKNSDRVNKFFFYTTLYGIGYFVFFMGKKAFESTNKKLSDYLFNKGIEFRNEFSDAGWVYRFVINKDITIHNKLLSEFDF